jgi:hypothetical protein
MGEPVLGGPKDVQRLTGLPRDAIYKQMRAGEILGIRTWKVGARLYVPLAPLMEILGLNGKDANSTPENGRGPGEAPFAGEDVRYDQDTTQQS